MTKTVATNKSLRAKGLVFLVLVALGALGKWGFERCEVDGPSMLPEFQPGDRVLLRRRRPRATLRPGTVVAFTDPRPHHDKLLIKRVVTIDDGEVEVLGDNPVSSTDSRTFGPVPLEDITWIVLRRYARASDVAHAR